MILPKPKYWAPYVQIAQTFCFDISQDFDTQEGTRQGGDRQKQTEQAGSTVGLRSFLSLWAMAYGHSSGMPP